MIASRDGVLTQGRWGKVTAKAKDRLLWPEFCLVISSVVKFVPLLESQEVLKSSAFPRIMKLCSDDWAEEVRDRWHPLKELCQQFSCSSLNGATGARSPICFFTSHLLVPFQTIRLTPALLWSERSNIRGEYLGFVCMHVLSRFSKHQSQRCPSLWLRFPEHRPKFTAPWVRSREAAAHCSAGFLHQHQQRRRIHPRNQWTVCEYEHRGNEKEVQQLRNCCCCLGPLTPE